MAKIDVDTHKIYDEMFGTLNTEGWKHIRQRLVEMFNQQNNVLAIGDEKTFWQQRGSLGMLHLIIEFEDVLKKELEQGEEDAE